MANPEHVKIVKEGKEAIDTWRRTHPNERLELGRADLRGTDLSEADLSGAHVLGADLSGVILRYTDFFGAGLNKTNLSDADLYGAVLNATDSRGCDFSGANLNWASFYKSRLAHADFNSATLGHTLFADCDLSGAINLDKAVHRGPSTIGTDTILRSGGKIPEEFLRGAGVPEEIIRGLPRLMVEVQYHSCFIAYGEPDKAFAERLHKDLTDRKLSCWVYSMDYTPGERTWREIGQRRREAGKFIVICSARALVRDGVLKEIEEQMDEDPDKIIPISRDKLWKEPGFKVMRGSKNLKPSLEDRNYINFEEGSDYKNELNRLLKTLERKQT